VAPRVFGLRIGVSEVVMLDWNATSEPNSYRSLCDCAASRDGHAGVVFVQLIAAAGA
jgi:hypothetical protein